jgi:hypothetical protein
MKAIYVHGVAQGGATPAQITGEWSAALIDGGVRADALSNAQPDLGYYADLLEATAGKVPLPELLKGHGAKAEFLLDAAAEVNAASAELLAEARANPASREASEVFNLVANGQQPFGLGQVIEALDDAFEYLTRPNLRRAIDERVLAKLGERPQTIVAHSLGSVVVYRLLRDRKIACRRFITIGSPLVFKVLRPLLDGPFRWPAELTDWRNFYDRFDPVCLGRAFKHSSSWQPRIAHQRVDNPVFGNHAATGYLTRTEVAASLDAVL